MSLDRRSAYSGSWLCPTPADRERFWEMQAQVRTGRALCVACCAAIAVLLSLQLGWSAIALGATMIAVAVAGGVLGLRRRRRPELWVLTCAILNVQVMIAIASALTASSAIACLLVMPVIMAGARLSTRGLLVAAPVSVGLATACCVIGSWPAGIESNPMALVVPLSLIAIVTSFLAPLVAAESRHRVDSRLDPLTGLLNRRGLEDRVAELSTQAARFQEPVSAIAIDIDDFKLINDGHGHQVGDRALALVADRLRSRLRSYELLYRVGGDEFLLVLPGSDARDAARVADDLRGSIGELRSTLDGVSLTCSLGVATANAPFALEELMREADSAMYQAKRSDRDGFARCARRTRRDERLVGAGRADRC